RIHFLFPVGRAKPVLGEQKVRGIDESQISLGDGLVEVAREISGFREGGREDGRNWIELQGLLRFGTRFGKAVLRPKILPEPLMGRWTVRIETNCLAKLRFGGGEVPIVVHQDVAADIMCLGVGGLESQSLLDFGLGFRASNRLRDDVVWRLAQERVRRCEATVCGYK